MKLNSDVYHSRNYMNTLTEENDRQSRKEVNNWHCSDDKFNIWKRYDRYDA